MSEARLLNVLRAPVISEKSTAAQEKNTLVFKVLKDATKEEIKAAVEMILRRIQNSIELSEEEREELEKSFNNDGEEEK